MLKVKNNLFFFILVIVIYLTHNWINFFYNPTNNVDFSKYYDYINYFLGLNVAIDYGQGTLYYYLFTIIFERHLESVNYNNLDLIISASVHELNLILFIVGLIGLYKLLKLHGYQKRVIFLTLILICFFPQTIYLRAVLKAEILAFALFPWCLLFIEFYLKTKKLKYLYQIIPVLILVINSKPSIAAMTVLYLIIFYNKIFKVTDNKQIFFLIAIFILLLFLVQFENYKITNLFPTDRMYEQEFDYKAKPIILIKTNFVELFRNPFFEFDYQENFYSVHANSVINITLLDTFGDYFNQLFDSQVNYFSKNRKQIFVSEGNSIINSERQIKYEGPFSFFLVNKLNHIRKILSIILSIIFYFLLIYISIFKKDLKKYMFAPLIGIFILYLNSLGIPSNNFNPYKGDTFKAFYYSFLLVLAFAFLACEVFKHQKTYINILLTIIFCFSIIFIAGHPKENNQLTSERIVIANEYSVFCKFNNILFLQNNLIKKIHPTGNIENYISDCANYTISKTFFKKNPQQSNSKIKEICFFDDNLLESTSNSKDCRIFWISSAQKINSNINVKPTISIIFILYFVFLMIFNNRNYLISKEFLNNVNKTKI